jgi:hypothetical protein
MRTVFRILFGLTIACLTAALIKVLHVVTPAELATLTGDALAARLFRLLDLVAITATFQALFVVPLALIGIVIAEVNRLRGVLTYLILGAAIAGAGFYIQVTGEGETRTIVNPYAIQAYLIEGVAAGFVYWLLAGRFAGWRRGGGLIKATPFPLRKPRQSVSDIAEADVMAATTTAKR